VSLMFLLYQHHRKGYETLFSGIDRGAIIRPNEIKVHERVGRGSFGDVYRGMFRGTEVAVKKILAAQLTRDFVTELYQEAALMQEIRHPNVLTFMGVCTIPPEVCIITEYMPRGSVYILLHDTSYTLTYDRVRKMALDTCRGMNYLHRSTPAIIHRDLKSHNLLVDENFKVKVSDFGLSRIIEDEVATTLTACGTPCWTAPEILRNHRYGVEADVYSFAIVLWEFCTRLDPYEGMPPFQVVVAVATNGLRPDMPETVPARFKKIIKHCWEDAPEDRPGFDELIATFEALQVDDIQADTPQPKNVRRKKKATEKQITLD